MLSKTGFALDSIDHSHIFLFDNNFPLSLDNSLIPFSLYENANCFKVNHLREGEKEEEIKELLFYSRISDKT